MWIFRAVNILRLNVKGCVFLLGVYEYVGFVCVRFKCGSIIFLLQHNSTHRRRQRPLLRCINWGLLTLPRAVRVENW